MLADNKILPIVAADLMWEMSLPAGADRDHEYCNPMKGKVAQSLGLIKARGWNVTTTSCGGDPLIDRQKEFEKAMEGKGVTLVSKYAGGECHGYDFLEPSKAELLMCVLTLSMFQGRLFYQNRIASFHISKYSFYTSFSVLVTI